MLNARHSFTLLWQRLVAALSLVMAAALAPAAVPASAGGAGAIGSRVGSGAAVASTASALAAGNVAALVEGGQQQLPLDTSADGTKTKACTVAVWQEIAPLRPERACRASGGARSAANPRRAVGADPGAAGSLALTSGVRLCCLGAASRPLGLFEQFHQGKRASSPAWLPGVCALKAQPPAAATAPQARAASPPEGPSC